MERETRFKRNLMISTYFEHFMTATILLNTVVLTLKWPN